MTKSIFWSLLAFLMLSSCEDKESQLASISLDFTGVYEDQPLVMLDEQYAYEDGMDLKFQLFQFYLSDIQLVKSRSANSTQDLSDIELVSFGEIYNLTDAQQGISIKVDNIPPGTYEGIQFGIGVSPDLNATQPGDYDPPHPLDGHYWSWATGYVFTKIEGIADKDSDGTFEEKLTFHIGKDENYRTKFIPQTIEISDNSEIHLKVDLHQMLVKANGDFLDFRKTSQDHTNDPAIADFLMDNLVESIFMINE